jgi:hypothetical protein
MNCATGVRSPGCSAFVTGRTFLLTGIVTLLDFARSTG